VIGDYNTAQPTQASLSTLIVLLAWLADRYRLDTGPTSQVTFTSRGSNVWPSGTSVTTRAITGHRSMSRTSCPGANLTSYVEGDLMADVNRARRRAASVSRPGSQSSDSSAPVVVAQESSSTVAQSNDTSDLVPVITTTTTTTIPPTPPPTSSPLILVASGIAVLATLIATWRARRMQGN
jgi:hypothetical protein